MSINEAHQLSEREQAAYAAAQRHAVWFDSSVQWTGFGGAQASTTLNGLVTNDVSALAEGESQLAAVLTPKGKIIADLIVIRVGETEFSVAAPAAAAAGWTSVVRKYVNPRFCSVSHDGERFHTAVLAGAGAATAAASAPVRVWRAPVLGAADAYLARWEAAQADDVQAWKSDMHVAEGSSALFDVMRVEAGAPAWGRDMDENTLPQEANLGGLGAISFTKGCYTGQETVARIHFRGHVNRHLRGLIADVPLPASAVVTDAAGKTIGDVRSTVISPRFGPIALGMIRREIVVGDVVRITSGGESIDATVLELPFRA